VDQIYSLTTSWFVACNIPVDITNLNNKRVKYVFSPSSFSEF